MKTDCRKLGQVGEEAVCEYLEARGHKILARNYRCGHLELDIVSLNLDGVHFVEVKTRRPPYQLEPQDCVTYPKQRRLIKAAKLYMSKNENPYIQNCEYHFDIAAVVVKREKYEIEYFPEAFLPVYY